MSSLHMKHVRTHLARVRDGQVAVADPQKVFLGADERDFFQELVGLRIHGLDSAVLAVLRFQAHGVPGILHARESLASYLTSPPRAPASGAFAAPAGRVATLIPRADEGIPDFLRALRAGRRASSIVLDPGRIRLAFDFRAHNPSAMEVVKQAAGPLRSFALRTADGHVLTGRSRAVGGGPSPHRFVALTDAVQVTPRGTLRLPDLMLNTDWISLWADVTEETARVATGFWTPFLGGEANGDVVLGLPPASATRKPATPGKTPARGSASPPNPTSRSPGPAGVG